MIRVRALKATNRDAVLRAVETQPEMVEIATAPLGKQFSGYLTNLPSGEKFYASEGKLSMVFWREGRRLRAA